MAVTRRGLMALGGAWALALSPQTANAASSGETAASFTFETIEGPLSLNQFAGKVLLIVNTASKCGFAPQLSSLETLWGRYRDRGLVVVGVPSGDFGKQELANARAIKTFCAMEFGVTFPLTVKTSVSGPSAHPFYQWAARERPGSGPRWNFHKYLIGRDGRVAAVFPTAVDPLEDKVVAAIEAALGVSAVGG
jgi:glutathione peroxidase